VNCAIEQLEKRLTVSGLSFGDETAPIIFPDGLHGAASEFVRVLSCSEP
jgi:hypothetical protein